jgi:hypothetical protein
MSEIIFNPTVAGIELSTHEQSNPVVPTWLAEALLLGEYWRTTGLFDRLQTQVRVNRGRMGQYEVCDFVLLLLAYAVSGLQTLEDFFVALSPVKEVLMSVWQRQQCPVASTLSRFLGDIDPSALEQLRTLFETDLWTHGFDRTRNTFGFSISMALTKSHARELSPSILSIRKPVVAANLPMPLVI